MYPASRRAFTLVELLVVLLVLGVLAAVAFPVFSHAREKSRRSQCASNAQQLSTALTLYAQDYDERLPAYPFQEGVPGWHPYHRAGWSYSAWAPMVEPYIKTWSAFACPNGARSATAGPSGVPVHFAFNEYLLNSNNGWSKLSRLGAGAAGARAADVAVIAESSHPGTFTDWSNADGFLSIPKKTQPFGLAQLYCANGLSSRACTFRHPDGGINVVFADGHAAYVAGAAIQGAFNDPRGEYPVVKPDVRRYD